MMEISEARYNGLIEQHRRMERERDAALSRAEAAERRVAELEARLAEQEWQPVSNGPRDTYIELKIKAYIRTAPGGEVLIYRPDIDYFIGPSNAEWGWRPLPPPPATE